MQYLGHVKWQSRQITHFLNDLVRIAWKLESDLYIRKDLDNNSTVSPFLVCIDRFCAGKVEQRLLLPSFLTSAKSIRLVPHTPHSQPEFRDHWGIFACFQTWSSSQALVSLLGFKVVTTSAPVLPERAILSPARTQLETFYKTLFWNPSTELPNIHETIKNIQLDEEFPLCYLESLRTWANSLIVLSP